MFDFFKHNEKNTAPSSGQIKKTIERGKEGEQLLKIQLNNFEKSLNELESILLDQKRVRD